MPENLMSWDGLDLHRDCGTPVDDKARETILEIASKALEDGDRDPKLVIQAARRVGRRAHLLQNLRAYAIRAIYRVKGGTKSVEIKVEQLSEVEPESEVKSGSQVDQIENRILIRELLDTLTPQDQEIFLRSMEGETAAEIDLVMQLKPRTAERRFRICKNTLRNVLEEKSQRRTSARGC